MGVVKKKKTTPKTSKNLKKQKPVINGLSKNQIISPEKIIEILDTNDYKIARSKKGKSFEKPILVDSTDSTENKNHKTDVDTKDKKFINKFAVETHTKKDNKTEKPKNKTKNQKNKIISETSKTS